MKDYFFQIIIDGETDDPSTVCDLYENLQGEIWHENAKINPPTFRRLK